MTTEQMRSAVANAYTSLKWRNKVIKMSDAQVVAIFKRLREQGKIKI